MENKPPGDEGWGGGEILARYERGVMLFLLILTVTLLALGAYLIPDLAPQRRDHDRAGRPSRPINGSVKSSMGSDRPPKTNRSEDCPGNRDV